MNQGLPIHRLGTSESDQKPIDVAGDTITVVTERGDTFVLTPVKMSRMPSDIPEDWLKFQRGPVPGTTMSEATAEQLMMFMLAHRTEAVTDGHNTYSHAGGMLVYCDPDAIEA